MSDIENLRVDRTAFSVVDLDMAGDDREYCWSKTPEERLEALEIMRQMVYGYDPATERLRRVLEIVDLE